MSDFIHCHHPRHSEGKRGRLREPSVPWVQSKERLWKQFRGAPQATCSKFCSVPTYVYITRACNSHSELPKNFTKEYERYFHLVVTKFSPLLSTQIYPNWMHFQELKDRFTDRLPSEFFTSKALIFLRSEFLKCLLIISSWVDNSFGNTWQHL